MSQLIRQFRASPISASVFRNDSTDKQRVFYTVSLQRTFKDRDGNFKHTSSLRLEDLHKAILVLERAYAYLVGGEAPVTKPLTE